MAKTYTDADLDRLENAAIVATRAYVSALDARTSTAIAEAREARGEVDLNMEMSGPELKAAEKRADALEKEAARLDDLLYDANKALEHLTF